MHDDTTGAEARLVEPQGQAHEEGQPSIVQRVAERVRADSSKAQLTARTVFGGEPFALTDEEFDSVIAELPENEAYDDVTSIVEDGELAYLYSSALISRSYAALLVRKLRNDPVRMIVETVREESEVYPRPTPIVVFGVPPFSLDQVETEQAVLEIQRRPEYADIHRLEASTGAVYLFSDRFTLAEPIVRSLVEWEEVGQYDNP